MIVVDASAIIDYLTRTDAFERIRERVDAPGEDLHAPHVLDLEVVHGLRRMTLRRTLEASRAEEALHDFAGLRVSRYPHTAFLTRIWELRANMTAFDAAYVALAEALDAPLLTTDGRLARAPAHRATIELIA